MRYKWVSGRVKKFIYSTGRIGTIVGRVQNEEKTNLFFYEDNVHLRNIVPRNAMSLQKGTTLCDLHPAEISNPHFALIPSLPLCVTNANSRASLICKCFVTQPWNSAASIQSLRQTTTWIK